MRNFDFLLLVIVGISAVSAQNQDVIKHRTLLGGKQVIEIGSSQCSVRSSSNARGDDESDFLRVDQVESIRDCCSILSSNPNYNVFVYCARTNNCFNLLNPSDEIPYKSCYLKYQDAVASGNLPQVYTEGPGVDFISGHIPFKSRGLDCSDPSAIQCDTDALLTIKSRLDQQGQQFYASWNGDNPCDGTWRDVVCANVGGGNFRVVELQFSSASWVLTSDGVWKREFNTNKQGINFQQKLPLELTKMQWLKQLETGPRSQFTGPIFPEISTMKRLEVLDIKENSLVGNIPVEISALGNLAVLDVSTNSITGLLPVELSANTKMQFFRTSRNKNIQSSLPPQYSTWRDLYWLETWESGLTGTLPEEYSVFTKMTDFQVNGNSISGSLPEQYSLWSRTFTLHVPVNNLVGTLPPMYSVFSPSALLWFGGNAFSGVLPIEYSMFSGLRVANQVGNLCVTDPSIFLGRENIELPLCS